MSEETNQEERVYTQAELDEIREKTIAYYTDQQKVLSIQCSVEELKARIKKAQFEAFESSLKMMQLNAAMQAADEEAEAENEKEIADALKEKLNKE